MKTATKPKPETETASAADVDRIYQTVIPLDQIEPSKTNPRKTIDAAKLQELADSIKAKGVLQPIVVRPTYQLGAIWRGRANAVVTPETYHAEPERFPAMNYELVAGERRYRAAKLAGLTEIPATVQQMSDREALEAQTVENVQREDLDPLEQAAGYQKLLDDHGYDVEQLAQRIGKSRAYVYGTLKLLQLPKQAQKALAAGELQQSTAQVIARIPDAAKRDLVTKAALEKDYQGERPSYRRVKEMVERECMVELKSAPFPRKSLDLVPEAGSCDACPKRTGNASDQYPDARADVCTDPSCYRRKVDAWQEQVLDRARQSGKSVLSEAESLDLFPYPGGNLKTDCPYRDLADTCFQDQRTGKAPRSYEQLLKGHLAEADVVLATDREGMLHRLALKNQVLVIIRQEHGLCKERHFDGDGSRTSDEERKGAARRKAENRVRRETQRALLGAVSEAAERIFRAESGWPVEGNRARELLRVVADDIVSRSLGSTAEQVCGRRGLPNQNTGEQSKSLATLVKASTPPKLLALMIELVYGHDVCGWGMGGPKVKAVEKLLGIDRKRIEREVRQRLKAERAARKAGKAKSTPANGEAQASPAIRELGPMSGNDAWKRQVRDPAEASSEGRRTIRVDGASFSYRIAPLPDGTWAVDYEVSYLCGNIHSHTSCWSRYSTREDCLAVFLAAARRHFARERLAASDPKSQRRAQARIWKLLDPARPFVEPRARGGKPPPANGKPAAVPLGTPTSRDPIADAHRRQHTNKEASAPAPEWRARPITDLVGDRLRVELLKKDGISTLGDLADRLPAVPVGGEVAPGIGPWLTVKLRQMIAETCGDGDPAADPDPACHRCGESGGQVVDEAALADDDTDLLPWDEVSAEIRATFPPEAPDEQRWLCGRCLDSLAEELGVEILGRHARPAKPREAPRTPEERAQEAGRPYAWSLTLQYSDRQETAVVVAPTRSGASRKAMAGRFGCEVTAAEPMTEAEYRRVHKPGRKAGARR